MLASCVRILWNARDDDDNNLFLDRLSRELLSNKFHSSFSCSSPHICFTYATLPFSSVVMIIIPNTISYVKHESYTN